MGLAHPTYWLFWDSAECWVGLGSMYVLCLVTSLRCYQVLPYKLCKVPNSNSHSCPVKKDLEYLQGPFYSLDVVPLLNIILAT